MYYETLAFCAFGMLGESAHNLDIVLSFSDKTCRFREISDFEKYLCHGWGFGI